jgi:hypothetical protein
VQRPTSRWANRPNTVTIARILIGLGLAVEIIALVIEVATP